VQCQACSTTNPEGAAFCMKCGARLAAACVACGSDLPAGAAFCMTCGHRVGDPVPAPVAAAQAPEPAAPPDDAGLRRFVPPELMRKLEAAATSGAMLGERRTVTMLFCDVQGSTSAAERLDPEEWAEIMNGAFEHLIAPVYRYEGTLARLMGDAILAFFGAPIGHEDDPERAVRAGLEILSAVAPYRQEVSRRWGVDFDVRVGINTGLVVVGAVGSDLRVEYTAMGDAVNVAARMEQTAAPGTVQVSEATRRLVPRLFEFESLGPIDVKGRSEPIEAHRVVRAVARPASIRGIEGLHAPMIGRSAEFDALRESLVCVREGQGRIVSVMAEAGLGKSRLVAEMREELERSGALDQMTWVEGRALSYETSIPFAPAARIVNGLLGVTEEASPDARWRAIESRVSDLFPTRVADVAPFLGSILGAAIPAEYQARVSYLDPGRLRGEAFRSILETIEASAARTPIVMVFEDLHWADSASIDLAIELLSAAERSPIGLILVFRPRRSEPSWTVHEAAERDHPHNYKTISLEPLDENESRSLVSSLLDIDGLPERVRRLILAKSEGNPFFLEEVIRSMIDQGVVYHSGDRWVAASDLVDVLVPDTLAAVIVTRLDRLDDAPRTVAQAASVLGREFRYDELAAVVHDLGRIDEALVALQRRDILREVARVPKRVFRFKHALMQETIYSTVLLRTRTEMHGAIGAFLERLQPERVEDIADHYLAARLPDQALPHLVAAGRRALGAYALPEALLRFERALEILDGLSSPDPSSLRSVLEGLGRTREMRFDFAGAAEAYARLEQEGERRADVGMALSGKNKSALVSGMMFGARDAALSELAVAEATARASSDDAGLAEACMYQCFLRTAAAEFEEVEYYMGELARLGEGLGDLNTVLFGMVHLSNTLLLSLQADAAVENGRAALAKAEAAGHLKFQAEVLTFGLALAHLLRGEVEEALQCVERGTEIALRIGDRGSEASAAIVHGQIAMRQGHFDEALSLFRRAEEAAAATGMPPFIALGRCVTGTCYQQIGGPLAQKAAEIHAETLDLSRMPMGDQMGAWIWSEVGHCHLAAGNVDRAEELFRMALDRRTMVVYLYRPAALRGLCEVAIARGELDEAARHLSEAEAYVTEHAMDNEVGPLLLTTARLAQAAGDHAAALAALEDCRHQFGRHGYRRSEIDALIAQMASLRALGASGRLAETGAELERVVGGIMAGLRDDVIRSAFSASMIEKIEPAASV
jgi:class 3 adenylate cyclase/tetratricopeptide (TPR) repeat protein